MSVITDRTKEQEVLLPNNKKIERRGNLHLKADKGGINCLMSLYTLFLC